MGSALRVNREFRLLWAGQAISALGSQISFVAYPLLALAVTGSPAKAGIVGFAFNVPVALLALPAGALADRVNRKHLMIASDAVRQLVEPDLLGEAVARNEARMFGAMLVGPPLGGLLFGLGRAIPFLADSISYAASVISKLLIKADFQDVRIDTDPKSAREGLRWVWERPFFRLCSLLFAGSNPLFTGLYLLIVVLAKRGGASSTAVGVMLAIAAGGGLLGAMLAPRLRRTLSARMVLIGENWVMALGIPLMLATGDALLLGLIMAAIELITPVTNSATGR